MGERENRSIEWEMQEMNKFQFMTAGESHGQGLIALIDGMVAGLGLTEDYIAGDLKRRQGGSWSSITSKSPYPPETGLTFAGENLQNRVAHTYV